MSDFGMTLDEMDVTAFLNMRDWLTKACAAQGAKMVGGGIGCGQADIDIEIEGFRYNVSMRPLPKRQPIASDGGQPAEVPSGSASTTDLIAEITRG